MPCLEEVWRNTLSGVDCSFLDKDNSAVVCLIRYASILLPGVYDISVKGGRHSADVRIIKYSNIDDFILRIAVEATCLSSSIENMQLTGVCAKYINDDAEGDIANGAEVETPCNKLKKKNCKNKKHKKKKLCESPKRLTSNDGAVAVILVHMQERNTDSLMG